MGPQSLLVQRQSACLAVQSVEAVDGNLDLRCRDVESPKIVCTLHVHAAKLLLACATASDHSWLARSFRDIWNGVGLPTDRRYAVM